MLSIKIPEALKEQSSNISILREKCKDLIAKDPEQFNDDLFLLRFALSHKDKVEEKGVEALTKTIEWRVKHKELLAKLATGERSEAEKKMVQYCPWEIHGQTKDGHQMIIIRTGFADNTACMENMTRQEIRDAIVFQKEYMFTLCDRESRKRGHLCKAVTLIDMKGFSMWDIHREFSSIMGEAMAETELFYPQLLSRMFFLNSPMIMSAVMALAELFLPARTFAKIGRCRAGSTRKEPFLNCPYAKMVVDRDQLPTFLGGTCECKDKGGCVSSTPNDMKEKVTVWRENQQKEDDSSKGVNKN